VESYSQRKFNILHSIDSTVSLVNSIVILVSLTLHKETLLEFFVDDVVILVSLTLHKETLLEFFVEG
jgi:hypothetical protein